jgi:PQQ-like domain/Secretion system C-terminal sorting domain
MINIIKFKIVAAVIFLIIIPIDAQQQQQIPWPTLADSPWPMMKHDPQATGRSPYVGPKTPNVVWTMDMSYGILSGPTIGPDNNLYYGTDVWLPNNGTNYFYSAYPDGTLRWEFQTGKTQSTNAGFLIGSDSTIYFGSQDHFLYAVTLDGTLKWKYDTGGNVWQAVMNTDLEGNLYVLNNTDYLYSINRDGTLNWKVTYESGLFSKSVSIAPDGQTLYIAGRDSNLFALNLDGTIKWKYSCGEVLHSPLVDIEGRIYIQQSNLPRDLRCISRDGKLLWSYYDGQISNGFGSPVMDKNGNIYFTNYLRPGGSLDIARLTCLDYFGNHKWTYTFDIKGEEFTNTLIVDDDGTAYLASSWGYYYYAISKDGELLWKLPLNENEADNTSAIGLDGTLYIGTHLGSLIQGQENNLIAVRDTGATSVNDEVYLNKFELQQNYPNPFNPSTTIKYQLSNSGIVTLKVYDILGREVTTLVDEFKSAGSYETNFSATGGSASGGNAKNLASGVYIYRITATNNGRILFTDSKQMILMK